MLMEWFARIWRLVSRLGSRMGDDFKTLVPDDRGPESRAEMNSVKSGSEEIKFDSISIILYIWDNEWTMVYKIKKVIKES